MITAISRIAKEVAESFQNGKDVARDLELGWDSSAAHTEKEEMTKRQNSSRPVRATRAIAYTVGTFLPNRRK